MDTTKDKSVHFIAADKTGNLKKLIDTITNKGVTAMTYFIKDKNAEEIKENKEEVLKAINEDKFGKEFVYVLALSNDGVIVRLRG